jgi:hypothetical protein
MASLQDDTLADKVVRFVIGALIGGASGFFLTGRAEPGAADASYMRSLATGAVIVGLLAVVLGNRFIEWVIRHDRLP